MSSNNTNAINTNHHPTSACKVEHAFRSLKIDLAHPRPSINRMSVDVKSMLCSSLKNNKRSRVVHIDNLAEILDMGIEIGQKGITTGASRKRRCVEDSNLTLATASTTIATSSLPIYNWSKEVVGMLKSSRMTKTHAKAIERDVSKLLKLTWGRMSRFQTESSRSKRSLCKVYHNNKNCNESFSEETGGFCKNCLRTNGEWVGICGDCKHTHSLGCKYEGCSHGKWLCMDCTHSCSVCETSFCDSHIATTIHGEKICRECLSIHPYLGEKQTLPRKKTSQRTKWYDKWIDLLEFSVDNVSETKEIEEQVSKLVKLTWGRINRFKTEEIHPHASVCREAGCHKVFDRSKKEGDFCRSCLRSEGEWTGVCYDCSSKPNDSTNSRACICTRCANTLRQIE